MTVPETDGTLRNAKRSCSVAMEGDPGPNTMTPSRFSLPAEKEARAPVGEAKADHPTTYKGQEFATVKDDSMTQRRLQERTY